MALRKKPQSKPKKRTPKKSPPPAKAASGRRARRRQTLAAALITGQKVTEVARREGVTRTYASHEANTPETRLLMAELLAEHRVYIAKLVHRSLEVIDESLAASRVFVTKEGAVLDGGEDAFARLTAVKRLTEMVQACRSDAPQTSNLTITWEQFLTILPPEYRR